MLAALWEALKRIGGFVLGRVAPVDSDVKPQMVLDFYQAIRAWQLAEAECQKVRRAAEEGNLIRDERIARLKWALERAGIPIPKGIDGPSDWDAPPPVVVAPAPPQLPTPKPLGEGGKP